LLTQCIKNEISFTALPGPSSVTNALLLSGMPPSSFLFLGFIPKKGKPKHNFLESIGKTQHTTILFETARRIENTISIINNLYPQGIEMAICREMTKIHEEVIRGSSTELMELIKLNKLTLKGEMVLVLRFPDSNKGFEIDESIMKAFLNKLPPKDAAKLLSLVTKESKREIYKQLLDL
jgi:16S rRNA (cytidine1402-2'-O)-methyltransferase